MIRRLYKGQIAVIMMLWMPFLLGAIGLGADIAVVYYNWVVLQKAADAAALANVDAIDGNSDPA